MSGPLGWLRAGDPGRPALADGRRGLGAGEVAAAVADCAERLRASGARVIASRLDNGIDWAVLDLASWVAGLVHVPVPGFFTEAQVAHVMTAAGVDAVVEAGDPMAGDPPCPLAGLRLHRRAATAVALPPGTVKVSFTSGSTGRPKGVCLGGDALARVAEGVAEALAPLGIRRHLAALPLAVLLENVAGLCAPLAAGAGVVLPPTAEAGLDGAARFDPARLQQAVERHAADSVIVLPQMLRAWTAWRAGRGDAGRRAPAPRFVAVGGAAVGAATVRAARAAGLAAHEGYGLTEGGSVQTLNLPGADRPGSAGRPLPHARLRIGAAGSVEVAGTPMLGYLGQAPADPAAWWPTGDLGRIDDDGFLHLDGRRDSLIVTAWGRNVSPEWIETALQSHPAIAVAVGTGHGAPALRAILWPSRLDAAPEAIADAVRAVNATLPDYARVGRWVVGCAPFDAAHGFATPNGRPRRAAIESAHVALLHPAATAADDSGT
jgi:long-subunit acyl-CoA synthetase (AMP-forming)